MLRGLQGSKGEGLPFSVYDAATSSSSSCENRTTKRSVRVVRNFPQNSFLKPLIKKLAKKLNSKAKFYAVSSNQLDEKEGTQYIVFSKEASNYITKNISDLKKVDGKEEGEKKVKIRWADLSDDEDDEFDFTGEKVFYAEHLANLIHRWGKAAGLNCDTFELPRWSRFVALWRC